MAGIHKVRVLNGKTGEWMDIDPFLQCRRCGIPTSNVAIEEDIRFCDRCCFSCFHQSKKLLRKIPWPIQLPWDEPKPTYLVPICKHCWLKSNFSRTDVTTQRGRIIELEQPMKYDAKKDLYYIDDPE
jgi:hypothetical protein